MDSSNDRIMRIDGNIYKLILARRAKLMTEQQADVSMNEALRDLLNAPKPERAT